MSLKPALWAGLAPQLQAVQCPPCLFLSANLVCARCSGLQCPSSPLRLQSVRTQLALYLRERQYLQEPDGHNMPKIDDSSYHRA